MLFLGTSPHDANVRDLLDRRRIGLMCGPGGGAMPEPGWLWALDNQCFGDNWSEPKWRRLLERPLPKAGCLFATVPDVLADPHATLNRFEQYHDEVRQARYPVAFVAQDGITDSLVPWGRFDVLFIGGTDDYKLSEPAHDLAAEARERGCWVHTGRLNSMARYRSWSAYADSCDGTFLRFGPATNVRRVLDWLDDHEHSPQLWNAM